MQAEDLSHSKLCLLSPLRGSAAPESRVSVLCLVIRGFQAVILSPVLGPGRAHLQTSGVHITFCNNPRLVCWWWGLRIQHVAAVTWHGLLSCYATLTGPQWGLSPATITRWMDLGVEQSPDQPSPPGIQTDSPRQCFANQVWTVQRTTDLRLRQERDIVTNSMARLEVKSFVTKCLKPLGSIIGWRWRKKQSSR